MSEMEQFRFGDESFREQIRKRFDGRKEPATVEDLAYLYRAMVLMNDNIINLMDVTLNQKRASTMDLLMLQSRSREMIEIIGEGLRSMDRKAPSNE